LPFRASPAFESVFFAIVDDLVGAHNHYSVYLHLRRAADGSTPAILDAPLFWQYVISAQRDAAVFHLCRAYDSHPKALSLRSVITLCPRRIATTRRDVDLLTVDSADSRVKKLLTLRHTVFAHTSHNAATDGRHALMKAQGLTVEDIRHLIKRGMVLLRRYRPLRHEFAAPSAGMALLQGAMALKALNEHSNSQLMKELGQLGSPPSPDSDY
jgi:hypothetical protein